MTTFLEALDHLVGLAEPHEDDYGGETYTTPSLINNNDNRKESNGEEAQRAAIRAPRT